MRHVANSHNPISCGEHSHIWLIVHFFSVTLVFGFAIFFLHYPRILYNPNEQSSLLLKTTNMPSFYIHSLNAYGNIIFLVLILSKWKQVTVIPFYRKKFFRSVSQIYYCVNFYEINICYKDECTLLIFNQVEIDNWISSYAFIWCRMERSKKCPYTRVFQEKIRIHY